jgi:DNA-binding ferritin-like protein
MNNVEFSFGKETPQDKIFNFLIKLMGYRNQLRMNHWQTTKYSEHKLTDDIIETLDEMVDSIGETSLGAFGRPRVNTISTNISDIGIATTDYIIGCLDKNTKEMISLFKETEHEGLLALLGELDANIKKFIYLNSLGE